MCGPRLPAGLGRLAREGADTAASGTAFSAVGLISSADGFKSVAAGIASLGGFVVAGGELFITLLGRLLVISRKELGKKSRGD